MKWILPLALIPVLLSPTSHADVSSFRIECDQSGQRIAFAYDKERFPEYFLYGDADQQTEKLKTRNLVNIVMVDDPNLGKYLEANYDTPDYIYEMIGLKDTIAMHLFRFYLQDKSVSSTTVFLNKSRTKITGSTEESGTKGFAPITNCISIGL